MSVIRSVIRSVKAVGYFAWYGLELIVTRPKTRLKGAEWLNRFCQSVLRGFDVTVTVEGTFPERGVLISDHLSYMDILVYSAMKPVVYCSKAEVARMPVLGWMATSAGSVMVERGSGGAAERAAAGMQAASAEGVPVVFFPEGTTTNGREILPFRSGLLAQSLAAEQPVTAAFLYYTFDKDNGPGMTVENNVCFWGDDFSMMKHIFTFVGLQGVHAHVKIASEPIRFSEPANVIDRKQAAVESREAVLALAGDRAAALDAKQREALVSAQ